MNDRYLEHLGRLIINTYGIKEQHPLMVGKLIQTSYRLLEEEEIRDLREEVNKSQWGDEASERRMDIISSNGNIGYE